MLAGCVSGVIADEVRLKDGSAIRGTVTGIDAGVLSVEPAIDSGTKVLKFKLEDVSYISTDGPMFTAGPGGTTVHAPLRGEPASFQSSAPGQPIGAWKNPESSPEAIAAKKAERKWKAEIYAELTGKNGNSDELGSTVGAELHNFGLEDHIKLFARYNYSKVEDSVSSDDLRGGLDYTWAPSWYGIYARTEEGYDKVKQIDFFSTSAAGANFSIIKEENQMLATRVGLSYRYEKFADGTSENGPGLDIGLNYEYKWTWGRFVEAFTYTPLFEDFHNYLITNDAFVEFNLTAGDALKLRLGVHNDYESRPQAGRKRLDTTYFARIVYIFE